MNIRLEKIAKELLINEDCVIIPDFGGFITHYRPAVFETNKNIILPPGKGVSFNVKLNRNDGLLAQYVSLKTGESYNNALKAIQSKVSYWNQELKRTNYLELEGLGSFLLNNEGNLVFEQFNETNFANSSFGLTNVHASPIKRVGLAQRIERGLDDKKGSANPHRLIKATSIAASILLLLFAGYKLEKNYSNQHLNLGFDSVVLSNKNTSTQKNSNEVSNDKKEDTNKSLPVLNKEEIQCFEDLGLLNEPENIERIKEIQKKKATIDAKFKAVEESIAIENRKPSSLPKFHVIAGCFGVESNATKMVKNLKKEGFEEAQITGKSKSGLLRVSYGSYYKKITALKALAKAKLSHNANAWLAED